MTEPYWEPLAAVPVSVPVPRIVTGLINGGGAIIAGTGFTVTKVATGYYRVTYAPAFSALPCLHVHNGGSEQIWIAPLIYIASSSMFETLLRNSANANSDGSFYFTAIQMV
jgi:hypothetical protein